MYDNVACSLTDFVVNNRYLVEQILSLAHFSTFLQTFLSIGKRGILLKEQGYCLICLFGYYFIPMQLHVQYKPRLDRHAITQWSVAHVEPSEQLIGIIKTNNKI